MAKFNLKYLASELDEIFMPVNVVRVDDFPEETQANSLYFAFEKGVYQHFGGVTIADGEIAAIFKKDNYWAKQVLYSYGLPVWENINYQDLSITKEKLSLAVQDLLDAMGGGSITNQPDDITLETKPGGGIGLKDRNENELTGQRGYKIIPADFDFSDIPVTYRNCILEISYIHDLGGDDVIFPENVTLRSAGGMIANYGSVTGNKTKIDFIIDQLFDGSGDVLGTWDIPWSFPQWFGAKGDGINNDTDAVQSAINMNRCVNFPSGTYLCDELTIPQESQGAVFFGAGFYHYSSGKQTVIKARSEGQLHQLKLADGADNITFKDMRIDAALKAEICIDGEFGSFFALENAGVYNSTEYGFKGRQGLCRIRRVFSGGHVKKGFEVYSDGTVSDSEFTGGTEPLRLVAGGNRINNIWANSGTVSCVTIEPLTSGTTHINTSISGLYAGETNGGSTEVPIIKIKGLASQKVQDVQMNNLHLVCAAGGDRINTAIEIEHANNVVIATPTVLGTVAPSASHYLKHFLVASYTSNLSVSGGGIRNCIKNQVVLNAACYNVNINGVNFADFSSTIAAGIEGAAILVNDASNYGLITGCSFDNASASEVPYAMEGGSASRFIFTDNFIRYANTMVWNPASGNFSGSYRKLNGSYVQENAQLAKATIPNTTVNKSKQNYQSRGQRSQGGSSTGTLFTLPAAEEDQTYLVTVRQTGTGNNNVLGFLTAYDGSLSVQRISQSNPEGGALDLDLEVSGSDVQLVTGSGYGTTTWDWVITRLG